MIISFSVFRTSSIVGRSFLVSTNTSRLFHSTKAAQASGNMASKTSMKRAEDFVDFLNASPSGTLTE